MVHQLDLPVLVDPGEDRLLGVGRALADLGAAGVVGDATDDARPDRGRADHRVGLAAVRGELLLERVERGAGQTDRLTGIVDKVDLVDPQRGDDDDVAVVVLVTGPGSPGEPGVGGLGDDDQVVITHTCRARHMSTSEPGRSTASTSPAPKRSPVVYGAVARAEVSTCRSEERRVGKECRYPGGPSA